MKTISCLAVLAAIGTSFAQTTPPPSPISYNLLWNPKGHSLSPVVGYRVGTIDTLFGRHGLSPEIWAMGGLDVRTGKAIAGTSLVFSLQAAKNVSVWIGPALLTQDKRPISVGLVLGATVKL